MRSLYGWMIIFFFGLLCFMRVDAFDIGDVVNDTWLYTEVFDSESGEETIDVGQVLKDKAIDEKDGVLQKTLRAFGIDYTEKDGGQAATYYVKEVLNRVLAILGLVALLMLIFGFYKMFVAKDHEEWFTAAKKIVINAVVAIVIIALAWFLVSWFFTIYDTIADPGSIESS